MSEHETSTHDENEVSKAPRRFRRKRMLALAGLASATLAFGGLTACDGDSPSKSDDSSDSDSGADTDDDSDEAEDEEADSDGGDDAKSLGAGDTAEWDSGLKFTIGEPEEFTPSEGRLDDPGNAAYKFTISVENVGDEEISGDPIISGRAGADGVSAEKIFDTPNDVGMDMVSTLRPGDNATSVIGFEVPPDAETLTIEVTPFDFTSDSAFWDIELG